MEIGKEFIKAIRELFIIRNDCYPKQTNGLNEYKVIKETFSDEIIQKHLEGLITVGSFQIDPKSNKVKWICFDFDGDLKNEFEKAKSLYTKLKQKNYTPLIEFSGRRGYHVWLFIEPTDASIARKFAHDIAENSGVHEIFPKQDKIKDTGFGGQVKIPLGIHRVSNKRSYFFNHEFKPIKNQDTFIYLNNRIENGKDKIKLKNISDFL